MTDLSHSVSAGISGVDGDFEIDDAGRVCYADSYACALLGSSVSAVLHRPLQDFLAAGQEGRLATDIARMSGGRVVRSEWILRRGDGSEFVAEVIGRGLGGVAMRFIARDLTQRKAAELAKLRLVALVESSDDAILSKTLTGIVTSWNGAAERMFGYTAEQMIGESIRTLIPPERQFEEDDFLAKIARGERIQNFKTERLRRDGSIVTVAVTVSPMFDDDGNIVGASKIARDISESVADKARLRESDERFRTLADNISQLAWMADASGWIFWYNRRWYDYTGSTLEEMQGWGWTSVHHPDHVERVTASIRHSWETGEPWEDTFPLRSAEGEYRWFLSRALPIRGDDGQIARWFGTNTDITEQKQREGQVRFLLHELNHRSKNLLALVQAIAQQTAAGDIDRFIARFQERIRSLAASQDLLVNSEWRGVAIDQLMRSQLAHFDDLVGNRITLRGPALELQASAAQALGMVIHELATNAGKYGALSNAVGTVQLRWDVVATSEGKAEFFVEWNERGGPAVEPPDRRGFGSVVVERMAANALGAEVVLDFAAEGVSWRLHGPRERAVEANNSPTTAAPRATASPPSTLRRVLIVDDDPVVAFDLAERLRGANCHPVGPAHTVSAALALLRQHGCDCALLDVNLGSESAEPVALFLRECGIPFIVLAGHTREPASGLFAEVPGLCKPVATHELVVAIDALFTG